MLTNPRYSATLSPSRSLPDEDPRLHYKSAIVDINFRPTNDNEVVRVNSNVTVHDLITKGPRSIVGNDDQQLRWYHLPANNMRWAEDLFECLQREQSSDPKRSPGSASGRTRFDRILREDKWQNVYHGRKSTDIHARFIAPHAARYSALEDEDSDSDEVEPSWHNTNVTSIYLPYLHWEYYNSWKNRQLHIAHLKKSPTPTPPASECGCSSMTDKSVHHYDRMKESMLLHHSLLQDSPLHDRRTLDQSYFYNLRNVAFKDKDQVIGQSTWDHSDPLMMNRKMMMVDQLWLWIIDGKTIVTAFPTTGRNWHEDADVLSRIHDGLREAIRQGTVKSLNSFTAFLVDQCTGVFHRNDIQPDLAFFEFIADEIGKAKTKLEEMYEKFHTTSATIESFWTKEGTTVEQMSSMLDGLFSIKDEIQLISDVENVIADLDKIDFLCSQQAEAVNDLTKSSKQSRSFNSLSETLKSRREAWAGMAQSAKATQDALRSLLDLKQRQATVGEARSVRYQIELSAKQGRSIMLLTVFTIFFMPLSVIATIFGMNAKELIEGQLSFAKISAIMFPTTITLVLTALALAFSEESRFAAKSFWMNVTRRLTRDRSYHDGQELSMLKRV